MQHLKLFIFLTIFFGTIGIYGAFYLSNFVDFTDKDYQAKKEWIDTEKELFSLYQNSVEASSGEVLQFAKNETGSFVSKQITENSTDSTATGSSFPETLFIGSLLTGSLSVNSFTGAASTGKNLISASSLSGVTSSGASNSSTTLPESLSLLGISIPKKDPQLTVDGKIILTFSDTVDLKGILGYFFSSSDSFTCPDGVVKAVKNGFARCASENKIFIYKQGEEKEIFSGLVERSEGNKASLILDPEPDLDPLSVYILELTPGVKSALPENGIYKETKNSFTFTFFSKDLDGNSNPDALEKLSNSVEALVETGLSLDLSNSGALLTGATISSTSTSATATGTTLSGSVSTETGTSPLIETGTTSSTGLTTSGSGIPTSTSDLSSGAVSTGIFLSTGATSSGDLSATGDLSN